MLDWCSLYYHFDHHHCQDVNDVDDNDDYDTYHCLSCIMLIIKMNVNIPSQISYPCEPTGHPRVCWCSHQDHHHQIDTGHHLELWLILILVSIFSCFPTYSPPCSGTQVTVCLVFFSHRINTKHIQNKYKTYVPFIFVKHNVRHR